MTEISVKELDLLLAELDVKHQEKDAIEEALKEKNKEISALESRATEALKSIEREEYDGPAGKIKFETIYQVKNPTDENKHLLWSWMRERGIYDKYAQVHATALKSLFLAEMRAAVEEGEDPITFTLPGMEPATIFEKLKFKSKK